MSVNGLTAAEIADILVALQEAHPIKDFSIPLDRNTYELTEYFFGAGNNQGDTGQDIRFEVMTDWEDNSESVKLYQGLDRNQTAHLSKGTMPWRHVRNHYLWERHELLMARDGAALVSMQKARNINCMVALAKRVQSKLWACPAYDNDTDFHGIRYFVPQIVAGQDGQGFYGGIPATGYTTIAGIVPSTSGANTTAVAGGKSLWRPWLAGGASYYTGINKTGLRTIRTALLKTQFKSPPTMDKIAQPAFDKFRLYCPLSELLDAEDYARDNNDNHGSELQMYAGQPHIMRLPLRYEQDLDSDTYPGVIGLNMSTFKFIYLKGDKLVESEPIQDNDNPDVWFAYVTLTGNLTCNNLRANFSVSKTA